ncbi:MAG: peptidylprolyl isomerase [Gemmatimonadaceae bacterium]|nr:peptidylprolyl isomerase [Gemmatimonadaceae bacterium]
MWILILPMLAQVPEARTVLEHEHQRAAGAPALLAAASRGTSLTQQLAARALGRLEDTTHRGALVPLTRSPNARVRAAAFSALAQMRAGHTYATSLATERDAGVRAVIYEALGRARPVPADAEAVLRRGLKEASVVARTGAARGIESLFRLNRRTMQPSAETVAGLNDAFAARPNEELRELALLTLASSGGVTAATRRLALGDRSAQVRRLAVMDAKVRVDDPSPLVRFEALRFVEDCDQLAAAANDASEHVALRAIERLGQQHCAAEMINPFVADERNWRRRGAALSALIEADGARARGALTALARDPVWQVRARAGAPARALRDSATLALLAQDVDPNVALTALTTAADIERALKGTHAGLLLAAAGALKQSPYLPALLPQVIASYERLAAGTSMTTRDPRVELLARIGDIDTPATTGILRNALADRDPAVAALAARVLSARTGSPVAAVTTQLPVPSLPSAEYIRNLRGATARITIRGVGTMIVALLPDDAPVTVGVFARLAEDAQYNGLTFHRIVPNFVIQGGSPGADEYDGRTTEFMRDEVGMARNARGTIGISTRGRDTGDGQIYFNLVDNFRLDRDYTVLARMVSGFDVMDRVQEGDVIERIEIVRAPASRRAR